MDIYQKVFISNIKKYRKEKKITQAILAEHCGVSTGTIGNIECGIATPSFDLLLKIADVLEIHPSFFFAEDNLFKNADSETQEKKLLEDIYKKLRKYFEKENEQVK